MIALGALVLALSGCGSSGSSTDPTAGWSGPPAQRSDGNLPVADFNDFLAGDGKPFASSPVAAVTEFLRLDRSSAAVIEIAATSPGEVRNYSEVVVSLDGLLDDSVRTARYTVELHRGKEGTWTVSAVDWAERCRAGRGHQDFSPKPCV